MGAPSLYQSVNWPSPSTPVYSQINSIECFIAPLGLAGLLIYIAQSTRLREIFFLFFGVFLHSYPMAIIYIFFDFLK